MSNGSRNRPWALSHIDRLTLSCVLRCLPHTSYGDIARAFGVHRDTIQYHAKAMGFPPRTGGRWLKLSPQDVEDAALMIAGGRPIYKVASDMGVSHKTLSEALRRQIQGS